MKKYLIIAVWGVGFLLGVNGVWASNAHILTLDIGLALDSLNLPYNLGGFGGEGQNGLIEHGYMMEEEPDLIEAHMDALRSRLGALGGVQLSSYLRGRDTRRVYPIQLALELIERRYPEAALLSEAQQTILGEIYADVAEIIRLISLDETLILENERCHVIDVLGLLLRASGCSLNLREWSFDMLVQHFLLEKEGYKAKCYLEIWAKALASGCFPSKYVHKLRRILLDCAKDNSAKEAQKTAIRALGVLLGNADLDECFQAEILRYWLDLSQYSEERGVEAVVQGMQLALRGEFLTENIRRLIFEALLLCPNSCRFPQFRYHAMGNLIDRALLDTWAEGLRAGWFDQAALVELVPVIMSYRFVRDCPIRTRGVVAALFGLLHARAEDSTFRQLVYQHIGEILLFDGQREIIIAGGVEQLSELFVSAELAEWERAKIIAYLVSFIPQLDPHLERVFLKGSLADALVSMLGCDLLSSWERRNILLLMNRLCEICGQDLDMRRGDLVGAVERFRVKYGGSEEEKVLMSAIVESLPGDDDDLVLEDDDLD